MVLCDDEMPGPGRILEPHQESRYRQVTADRNGHRDVRIVLVRPRDPRNVGAACRAMKCMGLRSLAIVLEGLIDPSQARILAHYAADVLEEATVHTDLREAIGDAVLVAGTTRRR